MSGVVGTSSVVGINENDYPYLRIIPLRNLVSTIHETIATSEAVQTFQLITMAKSLLTMVKGMKNASCSTNDRNRDIITIDIEKYLKIFSVIFERILSQTEFEVSHSSTDLKERVEFFDFVWMYHKEGIVDLMETGVPSKLLTLLPDRLEELIRTSLSSEDPRVVTTYCKKSGELFMKMMTFLSSIYSESKLDKCVKPVSFKEMEHVTKSKILEYSKRFISIIQIQCRQEYYNLFPSIFLPILAFNRWIKDSESKTEILRQSSQVAEQLLSLLDSLIKNSENSNVNDTFLVFFISINVDLDCFLREKIASRGIRYEKLPYLWKFSRSYLKSL